MSKRDAKTALYEQFARAGKGLANPKRLELLDLLAQGEYTVDALATAAGLGLSTASMHLQALKDAGLVRTRREGTFVHYRLAGDDVAALLVLLRTVATTHLADADRAAAGYLGPGRPTRPTPSPATSCCAGCAPARRRPRRAPRHRVRRRAHPRRGLGPAGRARGTASRTCPPTSRSWPTAVAPTACWPTTPSTGSPPPAARRDACTRACSSGAWPDSPSRTASHEGALVVNGSAYGLDSTYNAIRLAGNLAKRDSVELTVFLMGDGVTAAMAGQRTPDGYYKLDRMLGAVTRHGGRLLCCGTCMDARAISPDLLVPDAFSSTMDELGDLTLAADKVLVF